MSTLLSDDPRDPTGLLRLAEFLQRMERAERLVAELARRLAVERERADRLEAIIARNQQIVDRVGRDLLMIPWGDPR